MDVKHAVAEARDEGGREQAHETGEHHEARREALDLGGKRSVEGLARDKALVLEHARGDAARGCDGETLRVGAVTDDRD
jgi:hypothetical protein